MRVEVRVILIDVAKLGHALDDLGEVFVRGAQAGNHFDFAVRLQEELDAFLVERERLIVSADVLS